MRTGMATHTGTFMPRKGGGSMARIFRKFGGKSYEIHPSGTHRTKRAAKTQARQLRRDGNPARVVIERADIPIMPYITEIRGGNTNRSD